MRQLMLFGVLPAIMGLAATLLLWKSTGLAAPPAAKSAGADTMVSGKITEFLKNDHGDVDGLSLQNGEQIHFPPHLGAEIAEAFEVGTRVEVRGRRETRPDGEQVLEARSLSSGTKQIEITPPRRPGREADTPMNAQGKVERFLANRHDDVDGFLLTDGTEVKVPPHQGSALQEIVQDGAEVRIEGRRHVTHHGDVHLHADRIEVVGSDRVFERDEPVPHGRHRKPAPPAARRAEEADPTVSNAELLKELRQIRKLLEGQQRP